MLLVLLESGREFLTLLLVTWTGDCVVCFFLCLLVSDVCSVIPLVFFVDFLDNNIDRFLPLWWSGVLFFIDSTAAVSFNVCSFWALSTTFLGTIFCSLFVNSTTFPYSLSESELSDWESHWLMSHGISSVGISTPLMTAVLTTSLAFFRFDPLFGYFFWALLVFTLLAIVSLSLLLSSSLLWLLFFVRGVWTELQHQNHRYHFFSFDLVFET